MKGWGVLQGSKCWCARSLCWIRYWAQRLGYIRGLFETLMHQSAHLRWSQARAIKRSAWLSSVQRQIIDCTQLQGCTHERTDRPRKCVCMGIACNVALIAASLGITVTLTNRKGCRCTAPVFPGNVRFHVRALSSIFVCFTISHVMVKPRS